MSRAGHAGDRRDAAPAAASARPTTVYRGPAPPSPRPPPRSSPSADMIVKVKEPQPSEWAQLREGQILFTYLHLAPDPEQTKGLLASGCTAIAYETVTDAHGRPAAAGADERSRGPPGRSRPAAQCAASGAPAGAGVLLGGVPGVPPAQVVVHRRRRRRHACRADGGRPRRGRHDPRPLAAAAARARRHVRRARPHPLLDRSKRSRRRCSPPTS